MKLLPVALNLEGRRVLVVGGGLVAARKAGACLDCGAQVRVVAPVLLYDAFDTLRDAIEYLPRPYATGDGDGCALIFACTNRREVNAQVLADARANGIWCNVADDPQSSDLHGAAAVRRGEICIGITTGGGSPALSRHLRDRLADAIGPEYETLLELLAARRPALPSAGDQAQRAAFYRAALQSEAVNLLRAGHRGEAERLLDELATGTGAVNPKI